ncbi:MAG: nucleotidyl transferase AbiEii/AbiGii toxin family protein [Planctomycetia bacterium]
MNTKFVALPPDDRRTVIEQSALRRNLSPVILEKDFWVCWLLGVLFESEFAGSLVFKGGTALSKVFGLIQRFSEDIDLSLAPEFLGLPIPGETSTQGAKWIEKAEAACGKVVRDRIQPVLEAAVSTALGRAPDGDWFEFTVDPISNSPILLFQYPSTQEPGFEYLRRSVKLELGSLTDQQPVGRHPVRPWVAEEFPQVFTDWQCDVVALGVERSFWEKATILHVEHHRPAGKPTPDRYSRHYADTAALATSPTASLAVDRHDILERVVGWKRRFFGSGWASYDTARPGTLRLAPPEARIRDLRRDYDAMREMYLSEPASFDEVIETLTAVEQRINAGRNA